ncbi:hypothetical protein ACWKSP_34720 [Micromonosporaceae bacterium Da 78-11]
MTAPDRCRTELEGVLGDLMSATVNQADHLNNRPGWDCRACGQPWPCANAKADLLIEFRKFPSVLRIYMSAQMYDALNDLTSRGEPVPPDLYERFLAWARKPHLVA